MSSRVSGVAAATTKKKKKVQEEDVLSGPTHPVLAEGGFLPFSPPPSSSSNKAPEQEYGHLSHQKDVVLSLEQVALLVHIVAGELENRGLQTPLLFSTLALDLTSAATRRLIDSFLRSLVANNAVFMEDAKFAGPHELGMLLRWGLGRLMRVVGDQECRGMLDWETYLRWREDEAG